MPVESWYTWFTIWSAVVIVGVALEEAPLPFRIWKFVVFARKNGRAKTLALLRQKWTKVAETVGFILLIVGLFGELRSESKIESENDKTSRKQQESIDRVGHDAVTEGVRATQAEEELEGRQRDWELRLKKLEKTLDDNRIAQGTTPLPSPPPVVPRKPPPMAVPAGPVNEVNAAVERAIRETVRPGALISIIPFMPGALENFANDLGAAFAKVPGVQVAVGHGNMIMNGQTGLIVQYDHSNPVSESVFNALVKAELHPIDGPSVTGSVVFIKVAPPQ